MSYIHLNIVAKTLPMEGALELAQSARLSSQEELRQALKEEHALNEELLRTSQALDHALSREGGMAEPEPESVEAAVLSREASVAFSAERLAWSVEAFGGAAMGEGERLQLTSSEAQRHGSVYENQRRRLGVFGSRDYDSSNLTRADREGWTDEAGEPRLREPLPPGMTWTVNTASDATDADGWSYAFKFGDQWYDHERGKLSWVRRREWVVVAVAPADAAVPAAWMELVGPEVSLADGPADAATLVVEVRQARRVRAASSDFDAAETGAASTSLAEGPSDDHLCARVTWQGQSFQTERSVHAGPNPIWFNADNSLNCRQCLLIPDEARLRNKGVQEWTSWTAMADLESPVAAVRVWTELWVNLRIDRIEFLYADGSTNKYGTPSGDQGSAGVVQEHCLELDLILNEYVVAVQTFAERTRARSGTKSVVTGLVFTTSLGRSWAVGEQNPPAAPDTTSGPARVHEQRCLGIQANGQCITGLRVSQTYSGLLSSIDGISTSNIFQPINEAAVDSAQAQSGQPSPWKISVPAAWCSDTQRLSGDELTIELISPGRSTTFNTVPERSYGVIQIPGTKLLDAVGCDGWYILGNSPDCVPASEGVALGEVRVAWSFLSASVPSDLPPSAVPSPSAMFKRQSKAARAAVSSSAIDGMGFKIQEHALQSWMVGVSHGLCVEEVARRAWSSFDFHTATPQSTWRLVETYGVPAQFRLRVWPFIAGTDKLKIEADSVHSGRGTVYQSLCQRYETIRDDEDPKAQIRKDLHRTFPGETTEVNSERGIAALERLVGAYAMYNPRVGYCQSMNLIGGHLLLALGRPGKADALSYEVEETAFWLLRHLAEEIVPHYWAQPSMSGMMHHTDVLDELCRALIPQTMAHFMDIPMALVGMKWMAPLFGHTLPSATLYALWDRLLCKEGGGADILLCAALTVLRGIDSDVLRHAPHDALQLSAASIHDTAPFINAVGSFHRKIKQYNGSIPRAPHASSHRFQDEIESSPQCSAAWREMQLQAMKYSWYFTEYQMMRLADVFLSATMNSSSGKEACLSLSECAAVVTKLLPGLGLGTSWQGSESVSGGSPQAHTTVADLLCLALSKCEPHVHAPGLAQPSALVTLAQFGHGMHALHAGEASSPQRVALCFRMLDVNGSGAIRESDMTTALSALTPNHLSQLAGESGIGEGLTTAAECADRICRLFYPEGITQTKFASMVESRSTEAEIFLANLVIGLEWKGAMCLGIEL